MTDDILAKLSAPFLPNEIDWRVGPTTQDKTRGMALGYIDARTVMSRLDAVCGPLWQCEYVPMPNGSCCCRIGIKIENEWIWRSNGAYTMPDSDKVDAKEMAEKGSYSDAYKRAAVLWGIGQYLYDLQSPWVAIEKKGNSYVISESEIPKLHALLNGGKPMASAPASRPSAPREGTRQITPQEWVNASKSTIDTFRTPRELTDWEAKLTNRAKLEWLHTGEADLAEDMEAFIGRKRKKLAELANV